VARFLDPLDVRKLGKRRWMTLARMCYESDVLGSTIRVPAEFITDFASVPRTPLAWWLVGDTSHRAAVVHDYLYQHPDTGNRALADDVFREAMKYDDQDPEPAWRRTLAWAGVRVGGWWAWNRHHERAAELNPVWTAEGWPRGSLTEAP
jgi:hypothetical protein